MSVNHQWLGLAGPRRIQDGQSGRKMLGRKMEGSKWQKDDWQKDGPERGTMFRPK